MAKFIKLGEGARTAQGSFSDPITEINLTGNQVQKVKDKQYNQPHIKARLQSGHLAPATQDEYEEHVARVKKDDDKRIIEANKKKLAAVSSKDAVADEDELEEDIDDEELAGAGSEDEDEEDEDEDEDDEPSKSRESMTNDLKGSALVNEKQKAKLDGMSISKLIELHNKVIAGK